MDDLKSEVESLRTEVRQLKEQQEQSQGRMAGVWQGIGMALLSYTVGVMIVFLISKGVERIVFMHPSTSNFVGRMALQDVVDIVLILVSPFLLQRLIRRPKGAAKTKARLISFWIVSVVGILLWGSVFVGDVVNL